MYNRIAQICVLYEDLRIETGRLFEFVEALKLEGEVNKTFEVLYYIRRSTASLVEYRGALNQLHGNEEFEQRLPCLPQKFADHITQANKYFETNHLWFS